MSKELFLKRRAKITLAQELDWNDFLCSVREEKVGCRSRIIGPMDFTTLGELLETAYRTASRTIPKP